MRREDESQEMVVVGVDGSDAGTRAVRWAGSYARATGHPVRLVGAWHWPTSMGVPRNLGGRDPQADAAAALAKASAELGLPAEQITTETVDGRAAAVLVEQVQENDLLVVGSRGHGAVTGIMLGSVSTHCVHHAPCPVVVVP
jgi:nucleotide-binding universal stress UspA family protein